MGISLLVAVVHAGVLRLVGLELWLVFGVLAFLLNFIPNVGMATAVLLYTHMHAHAHAHAHAHVCAVLTTATSVPL